MTEPGRASSPIDAVLAKLDTPKRSGAGWLAKCPAHPDNNPSLSITDDTTDGRVLLNCHAGCDIDAVLSALGMDAGELFPPSATKPGRAERREIDTTYDYTDEAGELVFQVVRYRPKEFRQRRRDPSGQGWIYNLRGVRRVLYRLPEVRQAIADGEPVYLCEGEKDADAIRNAGGIATTAPMGAGKWRAEYDDQLKGVAGVIICVDRDEAGEKHAVTVAASLTEAQIVHKFRRAGHGKDPADHLGAGFKLSELERWAPPEVAPSSSVEKHEIVGVRDRDTEALVIATVAAHPELAGDLAERLFSSPALVEAAGRVRTAAEDPEVEAIDLRALAVKARGGVRTSLEAIAGIEPAKPESLGTFVQVLTGLAHRRAMQVAAAQLSGAAQSGDPLDVAEVLAGLDRPVISPWADVGPYLEGNTDVPTPKVLHRSDGRGLFYVGEWCYVMGSPGSHKSWVTMLATAAALQRGIVAFIDYEDTIPNVIRRLRKLGCTRDELRDRFFYVDEPGKYSLPDLRSAVISCAPELVVIDGVAVSMTSVGLEEDKATDVNRWVEAFPKPIARTGPCVIGVDHVTKTKNKDTDGHWPRGSGAKKALLTAAYSCTAVKKFTPSTPGQIRLTLAKDKHGAIGAEGDVTAIIYLDEDDDGNITTTVAPPKLDDPELESDAGARQRRGMVPLRLADQGLSALRKSFDATPGRGPVTKTEAVSMMQAGGVAGSKDELSACVEVLVNTGKCRWTKLDEEGKKLARARIELSPDQGSLLDS